MPSDYIMRLIEEIAAALAGIIAKQHGRQYAEARDEVVEKCLETIGMPLADVIRLSPEAVAELLKSAGAFRYSRSVLLGELLLFDVSLGEALGDDSRALLDYLHAFCLFSDSLTALAPEERAVYREKTDALAMRLKELPTNPYIDEKLRQYEARDRLVN